MVQSNAKGFEYRLANVVVVNARYLLQVQIHPRIHGDGMEELAYVLCAEASNRFALKWHVPAQIAATAHVDGGEHQRIVHRHVTTGIADNPRRINKRLANREAEGNADILHRVMVVYGEVSVGGDSEVKPAVKGQLVEHMVEECDPCRDIAAVPSVEVEDEVDLRFLRLTIDFRIPNAGGAFAHDEHQFSSGSSECTAGMPTPSGPFGILKYRNRMAVLVDRSTKVVVAGMTGREGSFHTGQMIEYGTQVVAGVTPGKGGQELMGVPIFDTMAEAVAKTGANASLIFVPAPFAADSVLESEAAGIPFVTLITEGVPTLDMLRVTNKLKSGGRTRLLGGNCAGIITPGECKMGIMPGHIFTPGPVGMVSRSGTLTYEVVWEMTRAGLGQTTCVGIGGDPIPGTRFVEVLEMFEKDPATKSVIMIGEIGGTDEEAGADYIKREMTKPVVAFISGRTAPPGKRMGHAGAIVSGGLGTAQSKVDALLAAGAQVADRTSDVPALLKAAMGVGV